jgi:hypothetical protein
LEWALLDYSRRQLLANAAIASFDRDDRNPSDRGSRLEGIKAIVERQQRMLAERNSESFLLGAEYR